MSPGIVGESDLSGNLQSEYVFFGGERVARKDLPGNAVSYYFSDHLKTASVITDSAGNIKEDEDYYPWGGELQFVNNDSNHYKFTGKERDSETGLDYFGARYYGNWLGRFMSADWSATPEPVPYGELEDPQSLNLYSYVRNIPTVKVDLDGHDCTPVCNLRTPTAEDWKIIEEAGKGLFKRLLPSVARVTVGTVVIIGVYDASPFIQTVGQSNADEIAERDRLDAENAQKLGQARGADEEQSQSDDAKDRARTNGGLAKPASRASSQIDRAAFRAEREAFWKAEAKAHPEKYSPENLARMQKGKPPIGPDGHPMELHHVKRTQKGPLRSMTRTDHRLGKNYKKNHP